MRIACCGYVDASSGSCVGAHFLMIKELLNRGHELDFYAGEKAKSSSLKQALTYSKFNFIGIKSNSFFRPMVKSCLPKRFHSLFDKNVGTLIQNLYGNRKAQNSLKKEIEITHQSKKYDLLIFWGLYAPFSIEGLKVVSWVQGPPQTEAFYLSRLKKQIQKFCGTYTYYKMRFFYFNKLKNLSSCLHHTDIFICGSQWSKEKMIAYGLQQDIVKVLPYPVNLDLLKPDSPRIDISNKIQSTKQKTFLWLGRIDPRKRFDLLMEAYLLLLKERQDVSLKIAGTFRFEGYKQLVDNFSLPKKIKYYPPITREEVPALIKSCSILIQPSEGENFGTSVAESLCCGVPVIIGPTNGTKDFVGPNSFIFKEYTPEALKNTMVEALDALDIAPENLSEKIRESVESNFSVSKIVDDLEIIIDYSLSLSTS